MEVTGFKVMAMLGINLGFLGLGYFSLWALIHQPTAPFLTTSMTVNLTQDENQIDRSVHLHSDEVRYQVPEQSPKTIADLTQHLESITVKVKVGEKEGSEGSGFLIQRVQSTYFVLTNSHVITTKFTDPSQNLITIILPDNQRYIGHLSNQYHFPNYDLALVEFESTATYHLATLHYASFLEVGDRVIGAGFPAQGLSLDPNMLHIAPGRISFKLSKTLEDGYQVGYTSQIVKGMSGGPVINTQGQVVAVNGVHAQPLWGITRFDDGSLPCPPLQVVIDQSSWSIPIEALNGISLQISPFLDLVNTVFQAPTIFYGQELSSLLQTEQYSAMDPDLEVSNLRWKAYQASQCLSFD